ncbi:CWC16 protein [Xylaria arbuscula]|nr:CWC16 protein [Xylaria arbuscula]
MQGFNMGRYVPPDVEGTISGNALNKKHALGSRASKLRTEGILTVRFEMPFGVWCGTCAKPTLIGQGVRFNAEKKKVGAYHSTPIWSFRMRHADCGGEIEIRTEPANAEYVVAEGGTRRDTGDDKDDSLVSSRALVGGLGEILTGKEKDALRNDAFARLEKTIEDRGVVIERSHRIAELEDASYRAWEDPYAQNRRLRAAFRAGRKTREKEAASTDELQNRMSLGIDLLPATEEDAKRAALVDFGISALASRSEIDEGGNDDDDDDDDDDGIARSRRKKDAALTAPLFATIPSLPNGTKHMPTASKTNGDAQPSPKPEGKKRLKSEIKASQTRDSLASEITRNTRASQDPFLLPSSVSEPSRGITGGGVLSKPTTSRILQGIKRKRVVDTSSLSPLPTTISTTSTSTPTPSKEEERSEKEDSERGERADPSLADRDVNGEDNNKSQPDPLVEYDSD